MVVREWMTTKLATVGKEASIQEALEVMKRGSIRHLPVVDDQARMVGWVTDADLRGVLIASMLEDLTVEDVMVRSPYIVQPEASLEDAAALILEKRIGGLPVIEDGKLVGVVTVVDILRAFIGVMGLLVQSSRIDVRLGDEENTMEDVARLIRQGGGEVISICHVPQLPDMKTVCSFRLKKCEVDPIVTHLKLNQVDVVASQS